jgi:hypothetical protein
MDGIRRALVLVDRVVTGSARRDTLHFGGVSMSISISRDIIYL